MVPNEKHLRTRLIRKIYNQISSVYSGRDKIHNLLRPRYYWRGILSDVDRYIRNYYFYN
jgi:hypothetical protein